jgi:Flp pilus assembly protein CpaB
VVGEAKSDDVRDDVHDDVHHDARAPGRQTPPPPERPLAADYWGLFALSLTGVLLIAVRDEEENTRTVPVPVRDLPAYRPLDPSDVTMAAFAGEDLPDRVLTDATAIANHYSVELLAPGTPITEDDLLPIPSPGTLAGRSTIGVAVSAATVLDGRLESGAIVDIFVVPASSEAPAPLAIPDVAVLDVRPESGAGGGDATSFIAILAVPVDQSAAFAAAITHGTIVFSRPIA